jgi:hypothetical protein
MMNLEWTHNVPSVPGCYLRKNPVVGGPVITHVFEIDGNMCIGSGESLSALRLKMWGYAAFHWWLGPIKEPPTGSNEADGFIKNVKVILFNEDKTLEVKRNMTEIKVNGKCPNCGFVHEHTTTTFYKIQGKNSRYAKCINCESILPYKMEGCTCTSIDVEKGKISIGDCPVHAWLKNKHMQS